MIGHYELTNENVVKSQMYVVSKTAFRVSPKLRVHFYMLTAEY